MPQSYIATIIGLGLVIYGAISIYEAESLVVTVNLEYTANGWQGRVMGVAWLFLGLGTLSRFALSRRWLIAVYERRYMYEVSFISGACCYFIVVATMVFDVYVT